jgi:hypothetical protein
MCDVYAKIFIYCMKEPIKQDKCKKEFDAWDNCYKKLYLPEFTIMNQSTTLYQKKNRTNLQI